MPKQRFTPLLDQYDWLQYKQMFERLEEFDGSRATVEELMKGYEACGECMLHFLCRYLVFSRNVRTPNETG
ncbi:hypothetical protein JB92DRAFT_1763788 [Gautieria morchelliformis]|nr:hypothetical protein JB92DRAFT_1763788 [Gautieria morchelliformis]